MDSKAEKKDRAKEAQSSAMVHVEPLAQCSARVARPSNGERRNSSCLVMSTYIPGVVFILGVSLLSVSSSETKGHLQTFLFSLVIASTVWMLIYMIYMRCQREAVCHKDMHAGPLWLRGAICVFGLATLVLISLEIVFYVNCVHCDVPVKISFDAVKALFILVQAFFLWLHARDCVHVYKIFTRSGLMLTLATNLMLWVVAVREESLHIRENPDIITPYTSQTTGPRGAVGSCYNDHPSCTVLEEAFYYIYPFHIEFCLFASTMIGVMLCNVGRIVDEHPSHRHHFNLREVYLGMPGGVLVLVVGVVILVMYDLDITDRKDEAVAVFYIGTTVIIAIMTVVSMVGLYIHHKEKREHALDKNPVRSLDLGLLWGTSYGSLIISIMTIYAILSSGVNSHINALKLAWCVLTMAQVVFQSSFIIEGIRCKPNDARQDRSQAGQSVLHAQEEGRYTTVWKPLTRRRKILKATCIALLFFNIMLWIMTTFGARPQFENPVGTEFYSFQTWATVVNICLPVAIFYRMHSAVSLFEVYLKS